MSEVALHPALLRIQSNGCISTHQYHLNCPRSLSVGTYTQCFTCSCGPSFALASKQDKNVTRIRSSHGISMFEVKKACFGVPHVNIQRKIVGLREQDALNCKEMRKLYEFSLEQELHSSETLLNEEDLAPSIGLDKPLLGLKEADDGVESRLFYLEERGEEELSRRILKLSRLNRIRTALTLYKSMEHVDLQPSSHACNSMISCLVRNGRLYDALSLFGSMKARKLLTGHACSLILKAVANDKGCDAAQSLFEELEADDDFNDLFDTVVYNTMLAIFSRVNNWVQAENIWRKLQKKGLPGSGVTYSLLVCTFVRCGQNELALDAYHEMVENGLMPGEDEMQAVIGASAKEGKWDLSFCVFQDMLDRGFKPSITSCNALITSLGKFGEVKLAFEVYGSLECLGHAPDAYTWNALLGALNKAKQPADALHLFDRVRRSQNSVLNLQMYITVLTSCQKLGLWGKALQLIWQMEASGIPLSTAPYNLAIGACEVARKPKVALQIYDHMIHKKLTPDVFTSLSLIRSCAWGSLWDEVKDILHRYPPNGSLYNTAIQGLCLSGNIDLAMEIYEKMTKLDLKPDGKTRALVLQKLPRSSRKRLSSSAS